jgi:N-acetylmuramoyl-L-alanine amidase
VEWEVNLAIAEETKKILEQRGIIVEILAATVPPEYWADVFVAIHADGSLDRSKSGYKVASPWRDFSGKAETLVKAIEDSYSSATGFKKDPNITRNMRGYYAFAWWRYEHSIHPMTTASILETGFLTNASDRKIIVNQPQISAKGLAEGIINFLQAEELL